MNCKICNKEFIPNVHNQKYCSLECQYKARQLREYIRTKSGKRKEYRKEYEKSEKRKQYRKQYHKGKKYQEYHKKYLSTLKGKITISKYVNKRRALKKQVFHEDYTSQLKEVKSLKAFTCYWCGKKHDIKDLHLDHIIPLSKGGADTWGNIALSCKHCNLSKNNKLPEEFNKTLEQPRLFI